MMCDFMIFCIYLYFTDGAISARSVIGALKSGKLSDSEIQKIAEAFQQRSSLPAEDWIKVN